MMLQVPQFFGKQLLAAALPGKGTRFVSHIYWAVHKGAKHVTKHTDRRSHGDLENFKHAKLEELWSGATWSHS